MKYKLSEQELKDLMHRSWLHSKKFYSGKTDEYFYDYFESEKKQLTLTDVMRSSSLQDANKRLDEVNFFDLMQDYRMAEMTNQEKVVNRFEAVKEWIRQNYA